MVFNKMSKKYHEYISNKVVCDALAGSTAAVVSVLSNNPFDVIKTRMQGGDSSRYKGFLDCGKTILLE